MEDTEAPSGRGTHYSTLDQISVHDLLTRARHSGTGAFAEGHVREFTRSHTCRTTTKYELQQAESSMWPMPDIQELRNSMRPLALLTSTQSRTDAPHLKWVGITPSGVLLDCQNAETSTLLVGARGRKAILVSEAPDKQRKKPEYMDQRSADVKMQDPSKFRHRVALPTLANFEKYENQYAHSQPRFVSVTAGCQHAAAIDDHGLLYLWSTTSKNFITSRRGSTQSQYGDRFPHERALSCAIAPLGHMPHINHISERFKDDIIRRGMPSSPFPIDPTFFHNLPVLSVSVGNFHTVVLVQGGLVFCCGSNMYGQLGDANHFILTHNDRPFSFKFLQIHQMCFDGKKVKQISAGDYHSTFVTEDKCLFACGRNTHGQLGSLTATHLHNVPDSDLQVHENINIAIPVKIDARHTKEQFNSGLENNLAADVFCRLAQASIHEIESLHDAVNKFCNLNFAAATMFGIEVEKNIKEFHEMHNTVVQVSAGRGFTAVLMENGTVWTWGAGSHGSLGHSASETGFVAESGIILPKHHSYHDRPLPGKVFFEKDGDLEVNIVSIATGTSHMLALTDRGEVYSWGANNAFQLGPYPVDKITAREVREPLKILFPNIPRIECGLAPQKCVDGNWVKTNGRPVFVNCQQDSTYLVTQNGEAWIFGAWGVRKIMNMDTYQVTCVKTPVRLCMHIADAGEPSNLHPVFTEDIKVGRWHGMSLDKLLALLMSQHPRNNNASCQLHTITKDVLVIIIDILNKMLSKACSATASEHIFHI